jgi:hypothetical protein
MSLIAPHSQHFDRRAINDDTPTDEGFFKCVWHEMVVIVRTETWRSQMKSLRNPLLLMLSLGGVISCIAACNNAKPTTEVNSAQEKQPSETTASTNPKDSSPRAPADPRTEEPQQVAQAVLKTAAADEPTTAQSKLPLSDPEFKGTIGNDYKDSKADTGMFKSPTAPKGAPNILLVLIDDAGFGATDTFGGPCHTWTKQVASYLGGTRNPMVVSWPAKIKDKGGLRSQFHHVNDIAPTLLEAAGLTQPEEVNGIKQKPMEGVSFAYTFADGAEKAADRKTTQYFELFGNRAIYHEGWMASVFHKVPWDITSTVDFENDRWELFHLDEDFSQAVNLAEQNPEKLKKLQAVFDQEAKKFGVLPLDDRFAQRLDTTLRPSFTSGRNEMVFYEGMDVGMDLHAPVNHKDYKRPYPFTGKIEKVRFELK